MKKAKMKLLLENWREYLKEEVDSLKIIMPPTDLQKAQDLIAQDPGMGQDFLDSLPSDVVPHEAIHALQAKEMPELFAGSVENALPDNIEWEDISWEQKEKYYSVPSEIMAFAYDYASGGWGAEESYKDYESIGGAVFEKFKKYVEAYKKRLGTDK